MVLFSTGETAHKQGGILGQYEYDENMGYYVQTSTEQSDPYFEPVFLYPDEDDKWWVGHGKKSGWLYNPISSKTPPYSGWQIVGLFPGDLWFDPSVTVTNGPLPHLASQFMVTASGGAAAKWSSLGLFTRTERWWNGRPVFVNTHGRFLHHGFGSDGWMIGKKFRYGTLRGSQAHFSPESERNWSYAHYGAWKPASVNVTKIEKGSINFK